MALSQNDYEQLHNDLVAGERNGHRLAKHTAFELSIIADAATAENSQSYTLHFSDGTPDEVLVFHNADGVRFHPIGSGPM